MKIHLEMLKKKKNDAKCFITKTVKNIKSNLTKPYQTFHDMHTMIFFYV